MTWLMLNPTGTNPVRLQFLVWLGKAEIPFHFFVPYTFGKLCTAWRCYWLFCIMISSQVLKVTMAHEDTEANAILLL